MRSLRKRISELYLSMGSRYLPFADITTPDLTISRLLRLSLFQLSVGMTLVLLVGTLNRVMIVELGVPAMVVGVMISVPLLFAPFRALIGYKSDTHRCELGWRRVPFIWQGTLLQFGGFAIMPFALLVLAGRGESHDLPSWIGYLAAGVAFLMSGAGAHIVQTAGLALATDLTEPKSHPRVVGLMYAMQLLGMIGSAIAFGVILSDFSGPRLIQLIQGVAVLTVVLNVAAMWKQEGRSHRYRPDARSEDPSFSEAWSHFCQGNHAVRRLAIVGLGTMAFAMSEVLLEPYGGQVLHWSVAGTTKLTALLALGGLLGLIYASYVLQVQDKAFSVARLGATIGVPALVLIVIAAPLQSDVSFLIGNFLIGFGAALFGHATLTASMNASAEGQTGLALGAWGAVQATAAGLAMAFGSIIRDVVNSFGGAGGSVGAQAQGAGGYLAVYFIEIVLLLITIGLVSPLVSRSVRKARGEADLAGETLAAKATGSTRAS